MARFSFPKTYHLRKSEDFQRAYRRKCSASDQVLLLFGHENGLSHPRLGLSVSRKVGSAVVRNRWKRILREAFRLSLAELPAGVDLVAIPRKEEPILGEVAASLSGLARRIARRIARQQSP